MGGVLSHPVMKRTKALKIKQVAIEFFMGLSFLRYYCTRHSEREPFKQHIHTRYWSTKNEGFSITIESNLMSIDVK